MDDDVGAESEGPEKRRGSDSGVDDERDVMAVGNFCDGFDIEEGLLRIGREFTKEEAGVIVDFGSPFVEIRGVFDPPGLGAHLGMSYGEEHVGTAIDLAG